ncbi:MAG TPA: glycine cleavage system aminomethyltransferase GcvT [Candidatus Dormibacteraeota bacterium]|jgi:aminomethyltransferase|nr:glycine cleavage system aminomethyltransferase GcvT [Candidatus Dormibacteraeota bacterium]
MALRTPLYDRHVAAGARIVEFGGFDMPLQYSTIREEHIAVRTRCGLFDLSHMGEVRFTGDHALEVVQRLVTNDVARLEVGGALYGVMCNEAGGIVDDVVVYREAGGYMVVINAACRPKDVAWMGDHSGDCTFEDVGDAVALLAVQGPRAVGLVNGLCADEVAELRPFHCIDSMVAGIRASVSRTGYTGEDGFELYVDAADASALWDSLLEAGAGDGLIPCGLGARDTLRLEAGLRLYGQDMDDDTDPYSCALGWTVKLQKGDFIGSAALARLDPKHPPRRFVGIELQGRSIARHGQPVIAGGEPAGEVTSGTYSFTLDHSIATASLDGDVPADAELSVDIRGTVAAAAVVPLPFYRRPKGA